MLIPFRRERARTLRALALAATPATAAPQGTTRRCADEQPSPTPCDSARAVYGKCRTGARVLIHEVKLGVVVGIGYWRRRAASESGWRPRRRAAVAAPDVEVGSVLLLMRVRRAYLPLAPKLTAPLHYDPMGPMHPCWGQCHMCTLRHRGRVTPCQRATWGPNGPFGVWAHGVTESN